MDEARHKRITFMLTRLLQVPCSCTWKTQCKTCNHVSDTQLQRLYCVLQTVQASVSCVDSNTYVQLFPCCACTCSRKHAVWLPYRFLLNSDSCGNHFELRYQQPIHLLLCSTCSKACKMCLALSAAESNVRKMTLETALDNVKHTLRWIPQ